MTGRIPSRAPGRSTVRARLHDRAFIGHLARIGEGHFGGFFGWPNLSLRLKMQGLDVLERMRRDLGKGGAL